MESKTFTDVGAKELYERFLADHSDVYKIAERTGFTPDQILMWKQYLFIQPHKRYIDDKEVIIEPSLEIAEAWQRLREGVHTPLDIYFLKGVQHELLEILSGGAPPFDKDLKSEALDDSEAEYIKTTAKYY